MKFPIVHAPLKVNAPLDAAPRTRTELYVSVPIAALFTDADVLVKSKSAVCVFIVWGALINAFQTPDVPVIVQVPEPMFRTLPVPEPKVLPPTVTLNAPHVNVPEVREINEPVLLNVRFAPNVYVPVTESKVKVEPPFHDFPAQFTT